MIHDHSFPRVCLGMDEKHLTPYQQYIRPIAFFVVQVMTERTVVDGKCVTSQGPATAMEFALKLVELVVSPEKSAEISKALLCA